MAIHTSIDSCLRQSMSGTAKLFIMSIAEALVALAIIVGIDVSIPVASSKAEPSREIVNRLHKVDRLPLPPHAPIVNLRLPAGCETVVSSLADARLANVAGRCAS